MHLNKRQLGEQYFVSTNMCHDLRMKKILLQFMPYQQNMLRSRKVISFVFLEFTLHFGASTNEDNKEKRKNENVPFFRKRAVLWVFVVHSLK